MRAGQLRERITLFTAGETVSGPFGNTATAEETAVSVWARVRAIRGTEALRLGLEQNGQPYEITIRWLDEVNRAQRVEWKGKGMSLTSVVPSERTEFLTLYAFDKD
jgi:SPP1 family predicted phage head-tail adaptor